MILPGSHAAVLILLIIGMLGWGLWANMFKAAGNSWRFELFYFDFAIGVLLLAVVLALTIGSLGFDGFSLMDDLRLAGKREDAAGLAAGVIFNLGNMLLMGAVSVAGMAVAFPVAMGTALIVAGLWNFSLHAGGNATFLFAGLAAVAAAIVFDVLAFNASTSAKIKAEIEEGRKPKKSRAGRKGVLLGIAGGLFLGSFAPLIHFGRAGENGLGPYSIGALFSIGVLFSTFVYNLFFMNLPVDGEPLDIALYFRVKLKRHLLGILAGVLWYAGMIATLIGGRVEGSAAVSEPLGYGLAQGGIVIAALCGIFLWREMEDGGGGVKARLGLMLVLLVAGIGLSAAGLAPTR